MMNSQQIATEFFDRYRSALLARDAKAVAELYAVPSLILFPQNAIAVTDGHQTEEFFASSWEQYEGIEAIDSKIVVMGDGPGTIWADVTWSSAGKQLERFCYQLVDSASNYKVAVLTPLEIPSDCA